MCASPIPQDMDVGFYIKKIHDSITAVANHKLKRFGLTLSQADLLGYLAHEAKAPVTLTDIERRFHLTHPTVVGLVQRLEIKGLVCTRIDSNDRRCRLVSLTDKAYEAQAVLFQAIDGIKARLTCGLSEKDQQQLTIWLRQIYENITDQ